MASMLEWAGRPEFAAAPLKDLVIGGAVTGSWKQSNESSGGKLTWVEVDAAGRTSQEGIFACGDITNVAYKQIVIAMGEGAKAALTASEYLMLQSERELPRAEMLSQTS